MAKLYFRYGAMNSGKSTALLQAAHNYEERGQHVLLAKPAVDTKSAGHVESRLGMTRETDFLIGHDDNVRELFAGERSELQRRYANSLLPSPHTDVACLLIDEAQFLTTAQVDDLFRIAVDDGIPVMAYGIRVDFRTHAFEGAARLLAVAHTLEELKTICRCGRKAVLNGRRIGDRFVFDGDQVAIDGQHATVDEAAAEAPELVTYESLCGSCYLQESGGTLT
ncbi:thymidine kinase [Microbacterium sp. YY-01]|uniref:thymidine kinase n=1 Tax=Microbacterium sp. YY-01 TaxID=3421634 RepID=UPI003D1823F0